MSVLVVDDDIDILTTLADQFELAGIPVDCASRGRQALELCRQNHYEVIVLDVMMPGGDGLSVCRELRRSGLSTPILFLTARDTLDDKIDGFEAGADDYLVKPFAMRELLSRVGALRKRISRQQVHQLRYGELTMDLELRTVERAGVALRLNPQQFALLHRLLLQAPAVVSREQLEEALWGGEPPDSDALRSHLYQLRSVVDKPFAYPMILTVRGYGYRLQREPDGGGG